MVYTPNTDQTKHPCTLVGTITTIPVWTVIITLDKGTPKGVTYDEGCFFCASNGPDCHHSAFTTTPANTTLANPAADWRRHPDSAHMSCETSFAECYPSQASATGDTLVADNTGDTSDYRCGVSSSSTSLSPSPTTNPSALPPQNASIVPDAGCDLKVFVVWDGTDANGNYLKSSNRRFSVYRSFAVATAFQSALNLVQQAFDIGNSVQAIAQSVPGMLTPGANERRLEVNVPPQPAPGAGAQPAEAPLEVYPGLAAPQGFRSSRHHVKR
jgi:hypothetical protein